MCIRDSDHAAFVVQAVGRVSGDVRAQHLRFWQGPDLGRGDVRLGGGSLHAEPMGADARFFHGVLVKFLPRGGAQAGERAVFIAHGAYVHIALRIQREDARGAVVKGDVYKRQGKAGGRL